VYGEREVSRKSVVVHAEDENRVEESLRWSSRSRRSRRMTIPPSRMRQRRTCCGDVPLRLPSEIDAPGKSVDAECSGEGANGRKKVETKQWWAV
jgi:hypothetical protein